MNPLLSKNRSYHYVLMFVLLLLLYISAVTECPHLPQSMSEFMQRQVTRTEHVASLQNENEMSFLCAVLGSK